MAIAYREILEIGYEDLDQRMTRDGTFKASILVSYGDQKCLTAAKPSEMLDANINPYQLREFT